MKKFASLWKSLTPHLDCTPFSEGSPKDHQVHLDTRGPDLYPYLHFLYLHMQESGSDSPWRPGLGCTKLQAPLHPSACWTGRRLVTHSSFILLLVLCWAELEGIGGGWKLVKGQLGEEMGMGQEGWRPTAVPGAPALLVLAPALQGQRSVLRPLGLWCCWAFPVKPAAPFRCVRAVGLQLERKACLGFSLSHSDSWQECAPRCQLSCGRGTGTFCVRSPELGSWKWSCLLTASWNHINNILLAPVIEAKRVCCWIKDTWYGHFIS